VAVSVVDVQLPVIEPRALGQRQACLGVEDVEEAVAVDGT
jgi:hypothetical protein